MARVLKNLFALALTAGILGSAYVIYQNSLPCAQVVEYRLGTIDPRFGTDAATLLAEAEGAARVWNEAAGKTLLAYDPEGSVIISLAYDHRQAGITEADRLETQVDALEARRRQLGSNPTEGEVRAYNEAARALNARISEFNESNAGTFDQGEYVSDKKGERITVFEFEDRIDLRQVLSHEFGHAIGLEHNEDPSSVMYSFSERGNTALSEADLASLRTRCNLPSER